MKTKTKLFTLAFIIVVTFFIYSQYSKASNSSVGDLTGPVLKVYYFDVGQGDSIFIKLPQGKDILIDGGPDSTVLQRLNEVLPYWDREIDFVVLTHPHSDHITGLEDVLKNYKVDEVMETDLKTPTDEENYFNKLVQQNGSDLEKAIAGERINLENDVDLSVLYPFTYQMDEQDLNDDSVVLKMVYQGKTFLFDGDATSSVEAKLIAANDNLKADFLKVGHHGSRYASSQDFLNAVKPLVSFISVGAGNSYGHPAQDTINRLLNTGSRVLRTDQNGTIELDVGGDGKWAVNCSKGCN